MRVFTGLGMAARRWYLLIPLVLVGAGVSWLAYGQMPASYTASVVHEVRAAERAAASTTIRPRSGLTLAPPKPAPDLAELAGAAAVELVGSVRPQTPAGTLPGRSNVQPITLARQPGPSAITIRAVADTPAHAREAVEGTTRLLTDRLRELDEERGAAADERLVLTTSSPLAVTPPLRAIGRKVGAATLAFCVMLSVLLAAAVERSSRRKRLLLAEADSAGEPDDAPRRDGDRSGPGDGRAVRDGSEQVGSERGGGRNVVEGDAAGPGGEDRGPADHGRGEPAGAELAAEPELLSGAEPALLADARPPLSARSRAVAPGPSRDCAPRPTVTGPPPAAGAGPAVDDDSVPTDVVPSVTGTGDDGPVTAVIPAVAVGAPPPPAGPGQRASGGHEPGAPRLDGSSGPPRRPHGPERPGPERSGPARGAARPPAGGRAPMEPRPAPPGEVGARRPATRS